MPCGVVLPVDLYVNNLKYLKQHKGKTMLLAVKTTTGPESLRRALLEETWKSHQTVGTILFDKGRDTEIFRKLEREATKMTLMSRAMLAIPRLSNIREMPSALEDIRAVWTELQKWDVSSKLSDAFETFPTVAPHPPARMIGWPVLV